MQRVLILSIILVFAWQLPRLAQAQSGWSAGVAEGKITPPVGTPMAGFSSRKGPSQGVHDDLWVRALVVSRGETAFALVTVELVGVNRQIVDSIRNQASRETHIPPGRILISATHTHSGPVTAGSYQDFFIKTAAHTIVQAWQSRQPAQIGAATATHRGWVGMNRRHLESGFSPVDKQISILKVSDGQGRLQAILYNYSCHAACMGPDNLLISADWPYYTERRIKSEVGDSIKVLYFQGTEGDVNTGYSPGLSSIAAPIATRNFAYAQEAGEVIADAILARIPDIVLHRDGPLEARDEKVNVEYYIPSALTEADARLEQAQADVRRAEERHVPQPQLDAARVAVEFAKNNQHKIAQNLKAGQHEYAAEIQAFRIGDAGFVSFPGEFFVNIGLTVKQRSPFHPTFCLGLANDSLGYIPTPDAYPEGGYEVSVARFGPSTAGRWESAAAGLLSQFAAPAQ